MIKNELVENLKAAVKKIGAEEKEISLEHPANSNFGDYSSSIALKLAKKLKKNPLEIAKEIIENLPKSDFVEKFEIVKPGFINFWLAEKYLVNIASSLVEEKFSWYKMSEYLDKIYEQTSYGRKKT